METKSKVVKGLKWTGLSQVSIQLVNFIFGVLLARLLSPQDYGLIGMVVVFTGFANVFVDLGMSSALIQRKELKEVHIETAFLINLIAGATLSLIFFIAAPFIASFYNEPRLVSIGRLLSINFFLGSLNSVQRALATKALDFKMLSKVDVSSSIIAGIVSITLAFNGFGVWSLIVQYVASKLLTIIFLWRLSPHRPIPRFEKKAFKELSGYSSSLLGFEMLNYWVRNLDNLLVGKYIGTAALGLYSRAYNLMLLPVSQITSVMSKVMFPAFASIQTDKDQVKALYLRTIKIIGFITFPMMIGLFAVADHFILTVYGTKWRGVIGILQILCIVGMIQSISSSVGWLFNSQGRTDIQFKWGIFTSIFRVTSFIIGLQWGVHGVAYAYMLGTLILFMPSIYLAGKLINLKLGEVMLALQKTFWIALLMGVVVYGSKILLEFYTNKSGVILLLTVILGIGVYGGSAYLFKFKELNDARAFFSKKKQRKESLTPTPA